ncbi:MAG TPA: hypothetical protein VF519_00275 [Mycobacteriales bacterium]
MLIGVPLRRALVAATAVAATVLPAPAPSSAKPIKTVTFVLRRTAHGASSYDLQVGVWGDGRGSFIGVVGAVTSRGRVTGAEAQLTGSTGRWRGAAVAAYGTRWSSCAAAPCDDDMEVYRGVGSTLDDTEGTDPVTHVFVVLVGTRVEYEFHANGWTLVRTPLAFRYLDGLDTAPAYARADGVGAETYTDGRLPGGQRGSIALGIPPCSTSLVGIAPRGVGRLTLDGGVSPVSVTCPTDRVFPASYAPGPTTWRFHGAATGDATARDTRLFVVDLPARLP